MSYSIKLAVSYRDRSIVDFEKCRDLETPVRDHSRSLKMTPFDMPSVAYCRFLVAMDLSLVVFDIFADISP